MIFSSKNINILILTNQNYVDNDISSVLIDEGYRVICSTTKEDVFKIVDNKQIDLILLNLPPYEINDLRILKNLRGYDCLNETPILVFSSDNKNYKIKAFKMGATDCISVPFDKEEILLKIKSFLKIRYVFMQNKRIKIDMNYNIPNLEYLKEKIENSFHPCGIFFQIEDFERIVYMYGLAGSNIIVRSVINEAKNIIVKQNKNAEIFAISEDRFAIFWDDENTLIDELVKINEQFFLQTNGKIFGEGIFKAELKVSVVANATKENFLQISLLLLKEASKNKPSCMVADFAYKEMVRKIEKTISTIEYINDAIKDNRVIPVYQPILDVKTGMVAKYESLVRIKKIYDNTLLSPAYFLEVAKQSEQYSKITKIMIQKTFEYMAKQNKNIEFSINLSSLDIENEETKQFLFKKLDEFKLHKRLIIELLEDESVNDFEIVVEFVDKVKRMGVRIAIDDYGSGYSNLERIFQFQPDFLKIDGSIIKDICENPIKLAIAKSAISLAKDIGIKTVSEYISQKDIFEKTKEIGVDFLQGYYIGKPMPEIYTTS